MEKKFTLEQIKEMRSYIESAFHAGYYAAQGEERCRAANLPKSHAQKWVDQGATDLSNNLEGFDEIVNS